MLLYVQKKQRKLGVNSSCIVTGGQNRAASAVLAQETLLVLFPMMSGTFIRLVDVLITKKSLMVSVLTANPIKDQLLISQLVSNQDAQSQIMELTI